MLRDLRKGLDTEGNFKNLAVWMGSVVFGCLFQERRRGEAFGPPGDFMKLVVTVLVQS